MTLLLASVTNLEEVAIVLDAGVDIIDLKNPAAGALGALPDSDVRAMVSAVDGLKPVSATVGDLPMAPDLVVQATERMAQNGVDIIKIGFFGATGHRECIQALKPLTGRGLRIIAVLFADQAPDFSLLSELRYADFYGVMLDTAVKDNRSLLDHISPEDINKFVAMAEAHGLQSGLAGSLGQEHIGSLARLKPGYIGFRGALCDNLERMAALSKSKVLEVHALLLGYNTIFTNVTRP